MKVLIAEDDLAFRHMLEVMLTKWEHSVIVAADGAEAWHILQNEDAPSMVILDWMMPGMDGIQVCQKIRESPDLQSIYIILLTTKSQREDIIQGLQAGADDYVTKPLDREELRERVRVGARIVGLHESLAERVREVEDALVRIKHTITGTVKMLNNILSMANPVAFGHASGIARHVNLIARQLKLPHTWEFQLAGMLSQIGCITLKSAIMEKLYADQKLSLDEQKIYESHPSVGASLVSNIPNLEPVARMIEQQQKHFKDYKSSEENSQESMIDLGAQILKVAIALDRMLSNGHSAKDIISRLSERPDKYNPRVVECLKSLKMGETLFSVGNASSKGHETSQLDGTWVVSENPKVSQSASNKQDGNNQNSGLEKTKKRVGKIRPVELRVTMNAEKDIKTADGTLLISEGQSVSPLLQYITEDMRGMLRQETDNTEADDQTSEAQDLSQYATDELEEVSSEDNLADTNAKMVLAQDIQTKDGHLLLAEAQETTPLMQHLLNHSRDLLHPEDYRIIYIDEDGKAHPVDGDSYEIHFSNRDKEKLQSELVQNMLKRMRHILQTSEYKAGNLEVQIRHVKPEEFKAGMVTREDIWTNNGILLLSKGQEMTPRNLRRLLNFAWTIGIKGSAFSVLEQME